MKGFFEFLAIFSLGRLLDLIGGVAKGYFARYYEKIIDRLRTVYCALLLTIGCLILFLSGFLLLHVAIFLALPWEMSSKICLIAALGFFYLLLPILAIARLQSRGFWLRISGAKEMMDDLSKKK